MITRKNYEIVFIDYFDGKLDKMSVEELFSFLRQNPDLQDDFNNYSADVSVPDLKISFQGKDKLKKDTITIFNYKSWLVGYLEKDLNETQKKEVDQFLSKNSEYKPELALIKSARLIPDRKIILDKKNSLKKGGKLIPFNPFLKRVVSIAAVLFILALTYFFIEVINKRNPVISDRNTIEKETPVQDNLVTDELNLSDLKDSLNKVENKTPENNKGNKLAGKRERKSEQIPGIQQKENQIINHPDSLLSNEIKNKENEKELSSNDNINEDKVVLENKPTELKSQHTINSLSKLSEIFNEGELKELGITQNKNNEAEKSNTKTLIELASVEFKKFTKSNDITLEKQKNPIDNSVTYALDFGKNFSISHTSVK